MSGKVIQYNAAIFPKIMSFYLEATDTTSGCFIDLPRGVSHLYLSSLKASTNARELELFEKYANGMAFTDADYDDVIDYAFVPTHRPSTSMDMRDRILEQFGITLKSDGNRHWFEILEDHIPEVRGNTWDCILVDLLHPRWKVIIECFDFQKTFIRKADDND